MVGQPILHKKILTLKRNLLSRKFTWLRLLFLYQFNDPLLYYIMIVATSLNSLSSMLILSPSTHNPTHYPPHSLPISSLPLLSTITSLLSYPIYTLLYPLHALNHPQNNPHILYHLTICIFHSHSFYHFSIIPHIHHISISEKIPTFLFHISSPRWTIPRTLHHYSSNMCL